MIATVMDVARQGDAGSHVTFVVIETNMRVFTVASERLYHKNGGQGVPVFGAAVREPARWAAKNA